MQMDKIYPRLNDTYREIRLPLVQPSSRPDTTIVCSLESISLADHAEYIALSYVWGDPNITEIRVNSVPLAGTTNLAADLRQLRTYRSRERVNTNKDLPSLFSVDATYDGHLPKRC
ncbi:uncharacterized protein K444DRAFT_690404 [Hyaloscypha bicolor E]|uniref:Uncharacterized protein n=1 Tax=Hyaloscypha bicolor E TaxID=1095630 RepID=A0A2J6TXB4_9HELO|nr:uncharacterized protein K444DRAFT_690404 [Hyaloscypha bicolor E]PMD67598.1 hypothetical protein K444DRAFT_690404 [Hyaloscypha bicolor E]